MLFGGLPQGHVYLVEGTPGAGKTTLALQFVLEGLRRGEKTLYITLSESASELRAVARSHGWDDSQLHIEEITPVEASLKPEDDYTIFHPEEVEMSATINLICERAKAVAPARLVIDSLAELRLLSREPVRYRRQALALKHHFTQQQITVLLLDDKTSTGDHQLHSMVHGVLTLQRLTREYGKNRRRLEVAKLRGARYVEGFHDYAIGEGGVQLYPRLISSHAKPEFRREMVSSNTAGLDALLGGGLDRGSSTLILGPSGIGKTTVATKYAEAAIGRDEPVTIYTFDEGVESLTARGDAMGMNLTEHMLAGRLNVEQVNPAELSPGEFAYRVRQTVEHDESRVVIIDSLNGYLTAMPQEEFLSLQMHEVLSYLNQRGVVTILILGQRGMLGPMHTNVDLSYLADTTIVLRFFEAGGRVRRAISVVKKRSSKHEQTIREFTLGLPDAFQIGDPLHNFQGVLTGIPQFLDDSDRLSEKAK